MGLFPTLLSLLLGDSPEFHDIVSMDKSGWPALPSLAWLVCLLCLVLMMVFPWAVDADQVVGKRLGGLLLALLLRLVVSLMMSSLWLMVMPHLLMLLMSGLMVVLCSMVFSGVGSAGCGVYARCSGAAWFGRAVGAS